jgi:hypothetical protein
LPTRAGGMQEARTMALPLVCWVCHGQTWCWACSLPNFSATSHLGFLHAGDLLDFLRRPSDFFRTLSAVDAGLVLLVSQPFLKMWGCMPTEPASVPERMR